jgi:hypothetical protein
MLGGSMTAASCLRLIEQHRETALAGNLIMIAFGVLYLFSAAGFLAPRTERKSKADAKALLAKAYGESENSRPNARRSKRYKFAKLCADMCANREIPPLVAQAAKLHSTEAAAAAWLANKFAGRAKSVADLDRQFAAERTSEGHVLETEKSSRPFLMLLRALIQRAEKHQQTIPFVDSVKLLAPAASHQDILDLVKQLVPHLADHALSELVELLTRIVESRRATVSRLLP